ncbi:MAG TPA: DEAD/DEAH box helicase [Planctomycetaceae bacterium]|nr:DEAD/DEAH box helicase [Planctomycetaceae bacterium]
MKTFAELNLIPPVQRALAQENYETPTPIQAQTIPAALTGRDILGCAQTGTGKTAAFALPILNQLGASNRKATPNHPLALILAPTRELAIQIGDSFTTYGRHLQLRQALVYGGVSQQNQVRSLNRGAHILVATPGRLIDLMNQGHIKLSQLEVFVLDEADRMLDMGFLPDLKRIISKLPEQRQSLFFSATLAPSITQLAQHLLRDPVSVNVTPRMTSLESIDQQVVFVERSGKKPLLQNLLGTAAVERALVFTKTKRTANTLAEQLVKSGFKATAIHGNKSQNARQRALEAFRNKLVQVLVATDVAARGIDIDGITHVINFDLPMEPENYIHRIGRTGRAGAEGIALSFCCAGEKRELREIEKLIGQKIPVGSGPAKSEFRSPPTEAPAHGRHEGASRPRHAAKSAETQHHSTRRSGDVAVDASPLKPKRRRRRKPTSSRPRANKPL